MAGTALPDFVKRRNRLFQEIQRQGMVDPAVAEAIGAVPREAFVPPGMQDYAYLVGQLTDRGTVAAAPAWDAPVETMRVRPSRENSYERSCLQSGVDRFLLHLRAPRQDELREELKNPRLERAIGVVYRPQTELQSHYFDASLPHQFDEVIWFAETEAVRSILPEEAQQYPPLHPFALVD